jgi:hypothetical protein
MFLCEYTFSEARDRVAMTQIGRMAAAALPYDLHRVFIEPAAEILPGGSSEAPDGLPAIEYDHSFVQSSGRSGMVSLRPIRNMAARPIRNMATERYLLHSQGRHRKLRKRDELFQ